MTGVTALSGPESRQRGMDEVKELLLVWTIALALMGAGIGVAQYATDETHRTVEAVVQR